MDKISAFQASELQRIQRYTEVMDVIAVNSYTVFDEPRARFIAGLERFAMDTKWLVEEIRNSYRCIAINTDLQRSAEENAPYEAFIELGKAALARFAWFPPVMDAVLNGKDALARFSWSPPVKDIHPKDLEFHKRDAQEVMEALQADVTRF